MKNTQVKHTTHTPFKVYLNKKHIDTVFYLMPITKDEVKRSLIEHDNYDSNIQVKMGRVI